MKKQIFDQGWEYSELSGFALHFNPRAWQPVTLPHDAMITKPRSPANPSGSSGGYFPGGVANYRKKFFVPEDWRGQSVQLEFEGVYMNAEVSVNNQLVTRQPYGYSSFIVDLTPCLVYGQENTVGVVANNTAQPNSRWYTGTGIYRHVWLRTGGLNLHIQPWGVFVTTPSVHPAVSSVSVATEIVVPSGAPAEVILRSLVLDAGGAIMAQSESPVLLSEVGSPLQSAAVVLPFEFLRAALVRQHSRDGGIRDLDTQHVSRRHFVAAIDALHLSLIDAVALLNLRDADHTATVLYLHGRAATGVQRALAVHLGFILDNDPYRVEVAVLHRDWRLEEDFAPVIVDVVVGPA